MSGIVYRSQKGSQLTSSEVDSNFEQLAQMVGLSGLTTPGQHTLVGSLLKLLAGTWGWSVFGEEFTNASEYVYSVPSVSAGLKRVDLVCGTDAGTIVVHSSVPSEVEVDPVIPVNHVRLLRLGVDSSGVDVGVVLGDYIRKDSEKWVNLLIPGARLTRYWNENSRNINIIAATVNGSFDGFNSSSDINAAWDGNMLYIKNSRNALQILKHMSDAASAVIRLWFQNGQDYLMQPGEIVAFKYNKDLLRYEYCWSSLMPVVNLTTPITYSDLKILRDNSELVPGMQYRITDYVTTVRSDLGWAISDERQFDIIVTANSKNKLNENARAVRNSSDTYFPAYTKFESWELKYCLDNDILRFDWADIDNGKGVIYYMKDENNNECSYDFKNIMFKRWAIIAYDVLNATDAVKAEYLVADGYNSDKFSYMQRYAWSDTPQEPYPNAIIDNSNSGFYYTFNNVKGSFNTYGENQDQSTFIYGLDSEPSSVGEPVLYTYGNVVIASNNRIAPLLNKITVDDVEKQIIMLNNIVLCGSRINSNGESNVAINHNVFGKDNCNMTFMSGKIVGNTFGNNIGSNTFGNNIGSNTFGNNIWYNTFGNSIGSNTFGNNIWYNTFGNSIYYCDFGDDKNTSLVIIDGVRGVSFSNRLDIDSAIATFTNTPTQIIVQQTNTVFKYIATSNIDVNNIEVVEINIT